MKRMKKRMSWLRNSETSMKKRRIFFHCLGCVYDERLGICTKGGVLLEVVFIGILSMRSRPVCGYRQAGYIRDSGAGSSRLG
jgi:hypothetical protein